MEYGNIDEATRREACEKVKKIAEAIKRIRKKYYLCFYKISDADKQRYNDLKVQMESIASANGLEKFNAQLIKEIDTQYSDRTKEGNGNAINDDDDIRQQYLKAIDIYGDIIVFMYKEFEKKVRDEELIEKYSIKGQKVQNYIKELFTYLKERYDETMLHNEKIAGLSEKFNGKKVEKSNKLLANYYQETKNEKSERNEIRSTISKVDRTLDRT